VSNELVSRDSGWCTQPGQRRQEWGTFFFFERKNAALPGGMADETAGGNAHPDARTANIACVCLA